MLVEHIYHSKCVSSDSKSLCCLLLCALGVWEMVVINPYCLSAF